MTSFDLSKLPEMTRPTGQWATALLHALARDEAAGRRKARLTEAKRETWASFRGRLSNVDLLTLLFEDAAVLHPVPFDAKRLSDELRAELLPSYVADEWLKTLDALALDAPGDEYIAQQAKLLGLPARLAHSEMHAVKTHHKVLELPGTGGHLAHGIVRKQSGVSLQDNFVIACGTWQEQTLAGVVGLDLGAPHTDFVVPADLEAMRAPEHPLRQRSFDFVIGLHPDKGGQFRVEEQLAIWYPNATVVWG